MMKPKLKSPHLLLLERVVVDHEREAGADDARCCAEQCHATINHIINETINRLCAYIIDMTPVASRDE